MSVDLRTCKAGDKLISKHGMVLTYVKPMPCGSYYDHMVLYPNGSHETRTHDGHVFRNPSRRLPEDHDIVKIIRKNCFA